ncbi:MAG: hypothetical protein ACRDLF_04935 [Solirubrobacteraceae bacterium]
MLLSIALGGAYAEAKSAAKTKIRFVAIDDGSRIAISGSATIPASAASARDRRFVVLFSLSGDGHSERFQTVLNYRDRFAVTHATKLIGVLKLRAQITENGQPVGTAAVKTVTVADPPSAGSTAGGGTTSSPGAPSQPSPAPEQSPTQRPLPREPYVVLCSPPVLPALEPDMGVVTGSFYLSGGPAPGEHVCTGANVTITTLKGTVVASKQVGSTESYAIAVPAGTYLVNAVATGYFVNGQPAQLLENREISVAAGSTVEIPVESQIP